MLKLMQELDYTANYLYKQAEGLSVPSYDERPHTLGREYHQDNYIPPTSNFYMGSPKERPFTAEYQEPLRVLHRNNGRPDTLWDPIWNRTLSFSFNPKQPEASWQNTRFGLPNSNKTIGHLFSDRVNNNRYMLNSNIPGIPNGVLMDSQGGVYDPFFSQIGSVDDKGNFTRSMGPTQIPWRVAKRDQNGRPIQIWIPPEDTSVKGMPKDKNGNMFTFSNGKWYHGTKPIWAYAANPQLTEGLNARIDSGQGLLNTNTVDKPVQMDSKGNVYDSDFNLIGSVDAQGGYKPAATYGSPVIPWRVMQRNKEGRPTQIYVPANDPMSNGDSRGAVYTLGSRGQWYLGDKPGFMGLGKQDKVNVGRKIDNRLNTGIGLLDTNIPNIPEGVMMDRKNGVYDANMQRIGTVNSSGKYVPVKPPIKPVKTGSCKKFHTLMDELDYTARFVKKAAQTFKLPNPELPWDAFTPPTTPAPTPAPAASFDLPNPDSGARATANFELGDPAPGASSAPATASPAPAMPQISYNLPDTPSFNDSWRNMARIASTPQPTVQQQTPAQPAIQPQAPAQPAPTPEPASPTPEQWSGSRYIRRQIPDSNGQSAWIATEGALPGFNQFTKIHRRSNGSYYVTDAREKYLGELSGEALKTFQQAQNSLSIVPIDTMPAQFFEARINRPPEGYTLNSDNQIIGPAGHVWGELNSKGDYIKDEDSPEGDLPPAVPITVPSGSRAIPTRQDAFITPANTIVNGKNKRIGEVNPTTGETLFDGEDDAAIQALHTPAGPQNSVGSTDYTASDASSLPVPEWMTYNPSASTETLPSIPDSINLDDTPTTPPQTETGNEPPKPKNLLEDIKSGDLWENEDFLNGLKIGLPVMAALALAGYFVGGSKPGTLMPLLAGGLGAGALLGGLGGYYGWFGGEDGTDELGEEEGAEIGEENANTEPDLSEYAGQASTSPLALNEANKFAEEAASVNTLQGAIAFKNKLVAGYNDAKARGEEKAWLAANKKAIDTYHENAAKIVASTKGPTGDLYFAPNGRPDLEAMGYGAQGFTPFRQYIPPTQPSQYDDGASEKFDAALPPAQVIENLRTLKKYERYGRIPKGTALRYLDQYEKNLAQTPDLFRRQLRMDTADKPLSDQAPRIISREPDGTLRIFVPSLTQSPKLKRYGGVIRAIPDGNGGYTYKYGDVGSDRFWRNLNLTNIDTLLDMNDKGTQLVTKGQSGANVLDVLNALRTELSQ